jgi:protoporphyrin/coproporphyrin ferrochelatase
VTSELGRAVPILFTAHSVPCRTIQTASTTTEPRTAPAGVLPDPYAVEAKRTAAFVAAKLQTEGVRDDGWFFAFQSQGISGGPWIGPTVEDTLSALRNAGHTTVIIQAIGFLCDHIEILYDIDIAFRGFGKQIGICVERTESLNESPTLTLALADLVQRAMARFAARSSAAVPLP